MKIISIGEGMIEYFSEPDGSCRRGFAGDTLNTAWAMAAIFAGKHEVSFLSRIGDDGISAEFSAFVAGAGIGVDKLAADSERTLGLYTIATDEVGERSFSYWRSASAARLIAQDASALAAQLDGADYVYLSGITAAVQEADGRDNLISALKIAKAKGAKIVYDSNHRPKLWGSSQAALEFCERVGAIADIMLPTFDDEVDIAGDTSPEDTIARLSSYGCKEIVLTNGADPVRCHSDGKTVVLPLAKPMTPIDTTGAGDSFSGTYLAARVLGNAPEVAVKHGQAVSGVVVMVRGALVPHDVLHKAYNSAG